MGDPRKVPVQFNIKIPWEWKQFLEEKAAADRTSQNKLAYEALQRSYGREFNLYKKSLAGQTEPQPPPAPTYSADDL